VDVYKASKLLTIHD